MKKIFEVSFLACLAVFLFLFSANLFSGDFVRTSQSFSKSITDSTIVNIYVLFPDQWGEWYISETLPTKTKGQWMRGTTFSFPDQVSIVFEPTTGGGETDSLLHYIQPLVWDASDEAFAEITSDICFVNFGEDGDYVASDSTNYLDWDDATEYSTVLNRWNPVKTDSVAWFWPTPGFVIHVRYVCADGGSLTYDMSIQGVFDE